jgi:hypothetical protein
MRPPIHRGEWYEAMMTMDDNAQSRWAEIVRAREAPLFYVVDGTADILFASKPVAQAKPAGAFSLMLHAAIAATREGDASPALVFEGRLVRSERLTTPQGADRYVVFLERMEADGGR